MDSSWFKEDVRKAKEEGLDVKELKKESEKALKNSTLFQRRLNEILKAWFEETERSDTDFSKPTWERETVANIAKRQTLLKVMKLINF